MRKLLTICAVVVFMFAFSITANAVEWNVPGDGTIQAVIDGATSGDIINVAAGTYDEQVVIYNKSLTLQGAGETTIIQPSGPELMPTPSIPWIGGGTGTMSAIVSVETAGGEVTIRDLQIDGSLITSKSTTWQGGLVYLETSGKVEGVTVNGGSTLPDRTAGIFAAAITESVSLEVTGCSVEVYTRAGIYALGETMTANYHHNVINGPGDASAGVPNGIFFLRGVNGSATYNTVTDLSYTGETYRSTGIGTYNAGANITFAYNTISNVQNAFALAKNTSGTVVEHNEAYNCHTGVKMESGAANSVIQYNDLHDNDFAIRCGSAMGGGNVVHYNNFVNNPGLEWTSGDETYVGAVCNVHTTYILDAENNWWGDASGPFDDIGDVMVPPCGGVYVNDMWTSGTGDSVSNNVDYCPWLEELYSTPVANAGLDQNVDEGVTVTLDGSDSKDADGEIVSYLWGQTSGISMTLSDINAVQPTFTSPDVGPDGESFTFQLTVTDNEGLEDTDTCIVNVTWDNNPPIADAGVDQTVVGEGVTVTLDGSDSKDADGEIQGYLWTQTVGPPVTLSDASAVQPTFVTPIVAPSGTRLEFLLLVIDDGGLQSTDICIVNVEPEPEPAPLRGDDNGPCFIGTTSE